MSSKKIKSPTQSAFDSIVAWRTKNSILKDQLKKLENITEIHAIAVMSFLLKAQLIEFELKQLITSLDLHLGFSSHSPILNRKPETPRDNERAPLSLLKEKINLYEGEFLNGLKGNLPLVVATRNQFTHDLFGLGDIEELIKKAQEGIRRSNLVLEEIEKIHDILDKNDPIKSLIEKKG